MSHYYKTDYNLNEENITIDFNFGNQSFSFVSNSGIFSKSHIDQGSRLLLDYLATLELKGDLLDVGCGYGIIGIVIKKLKPELTVTMSDVNERAVQAALANCRINNVTAAVQTSDLFEQLGEVYDYIVTNPPIRAGKAVVQALVKEALEHLRIGASLILVVRKQQGALSLLKLVRSVFGNGEIVKKKHGYCILRADRR